MKEYDLIIAGGCASGLAAAILAKREYPGIKIALLEKLPRVGKKLLSTGNGRCNFTNLSITPQDYYGNSFVSAVLGEYPPEKIIDFFKSLGLESYSDSAGRVYPRSNTAASLLDSLRLEVDESDTDVFTDCEVKSVYHSDKGFIVNDEFKSDK
ncbi:MAG: NAD(P)/FAD-dependent oxidoreductase, partial [Clostridia bacterium]|nr:NAD(P)/FAD-dependent oxidoreductase [Clostridia bacterium]